MIDNDEVRYSTSTLRAWKAQAEAQAPGALLTRWGRAKYLCVRTGDRAGFQRDLEWVLAQDPRRADGPYRWNVYFQRDAREMLSRIDRSF